MAINGPLSVSFDEVFPCGAYAVGVEQQRNFDKSSRDNFVQAHTDEGTSIWVATVVERVTGIEPA